MLGRERLPHGQAPGECAEERRDDVEQEREDDPAPDDDLERVEDASPVRPAPPDDDEREDERRESDEALGPARPPHAQHGLHAARASATAIPVTLAYTSSSRFAIAGHAYCSTASDARRVAQRRAPRLVGDERAYGVGERARVVRRHGDGGLVGQHLAIAGNVRGDGREPARERPREHHAEALLTDRRRDERLRAEQGPRQLVLAEEADDVDPVVRDAKAREQKAHGKRVGAGDRQPQARSPMDVGPGAEKNLQPLARLLPPGEHDAVLASTRRGRRGNEHAVRNHLVVTRQPAILGCLRAFRDRDAVVDPVDQKAPERRRASHPAELSGRVERRDERTSCPDERGQADRRRHRLVQVEDVEALALERADDPKVRAGRQHDVRERAVRRNDHGTADGYHVRRRLPVAADARVQDARELTRWVVAHDQAHVVATLLECRRLQLCMLDDRAPERPRERDDDPDLHAVETNDRWLGCGDATRRDPPRHMHHGGCTAERRLLYTRPRPPDGEEDGQPGRPDRLSPLLRGRGRHAGQRHHVLRVSGCSPRERRRRDGAHRAVARGIGRPRSTSGRAGSRARWARRATTGA